MERIELGGNDLADATSDALPPIAARIRVPKTSELVADQFRSQIIRGELAEGDFLPPEGQLMTTLKISRPTLREAFRILEAESLISVVRGSRTGARVHRPSVELVSRYAGYTLEAQGTTIADLYDARLAIEPHAVRRLTLARDPKVVVRLREHIKRLQVLIDDERVADYYGDLATFHRSLVKLTGSKTLQFLNYLLLHLLTSHQLDVVRRQPRPLEKQRKNMALGLRSCSKLVDLIEGGDVDAAIGHWRLHLQTTNKAWLADGEGERVVDSLSGGRDLSY